MAVVRPHSVIARLRAAIARAALGLWPFYVGLGRVVGLVGLPTPPATLATRRLRGLPLRLRFNSHSCQGRFLYYRGIYEERLIERLRELLKPGMTFVDVGANVGLYSAVAAYCVGPTGRVLACEPQPGLAPTFIANMEMNGLDNVILENVALGSANGTSDLYQVTEHDVQATLRLQPTERSVGPVMRVPVRTLSDVLRAHQIRAMDGMKIDVEGAELDVLEGFDAWRETPPRFILFECIDALLARFGHTGDQLVKFLEARGYVIHEPLRTRWAPVVHDGSPWSKDLVALHPSWERS